MNSLINKAVQYKINRRTFLGWSAVATAGLAVAGSNTGLTHLRSGTAEAAGEGTWVTAACWHNCGGRCLNKVLVQDGVVLRQKTDDTHPDSPDFPQQRGCARGRSQRKQVFAADRIKYPMKRKNWAPGGGKKELRGKDEWVRISWEEALDIVASETKRIKDQHGNESILALSANNRVLMASGGAMQAWGMVSVGAWPIPGGLMSANVFDMVNDRLDLRNSKLVVLWGANPAWSSGGSPNYNYLQSKKAGAKVIVIDPMYSATATSMADEWIPVRPGTDAALLLGMAHYMITNNLQDQAFLNQYTIGFDADHMPKDADPKGNFKDYVLGTYDGVPKTPEWASEICGTDPHTIRDFARELATTKPAAFISSYAPARTYRGEQYVQAFLTVGWMTGNVGLPGAMVGDSAHAGAGNGGNPLVFSPGDGVPQIPNPICRDSMEIFFGTASADAFYGIVWDEVWDAVVTGEFTVGKDKKRKCNIQEIWNIGEGSALNQIPHINRGIEAFRKVEFVVTSGHFLTSNAKYSDLVLPATTQWERLGGLLSGNREMLIYFSQVTKPMYEAKDDIWMEQEIAKRMGLDPKVIMPFSDAQRLYNQLAGAVVMREDGTGYEPLVTITQADITGMGVEGKPQQGRISLKEFREKGVFQVARTPSDKYGHIAFAAFRADPVKNPLKTESGRLEIYCRTLPAAIEGRGWTTADPIAKYVPVKEGFEDTFADWNSRKKGDFPLQLFTPHYPRRSHSILDNVTWLREAFPQEFFMNPVDAKTRGIKMGDVVKVTSPHGSVIRPVYVTERIVPGACALGEGAWVDRDDETGIDKAGATNSLSGSNPCGQGVQPWNTCIVQVEKYDKPLAPDYQWPQRIVL